MLKFIIKIIIIAIAVMIIGNILIDNFISTEANCKEVATLGWGC